LVDYYAIPDFQPGEEQGSISPETAGGCFGLSNIKATNMPVYGREYGSETVLPATLGRSPCDDTDDIDSLKRPGQEFERVVP